MKKDITIVTGNPNKVKDIGHLLGLELSRSDIELTEIQSTDVAEVAKHKAIEAYAKLKRPVLVDDAGLTFEQWGKLPGAFIKYFIEEVGGDGILAMLQNAESRDCYMECAMAYCDENGPQIFIGRVDGTVATEQRGTNGWGYDTIVVPNGESMTCAELEGEKYWYYSSRQRAVNNLKEGLGL